MKRDDFGVRIDEIRELATKYSKPDLARMVQMGALDPQKAVMAGMMIDRIAQSAMKPPETTVAQDVLGQQPTSAQGQIPAGIMAAPGAPEPSAGVAALPSGITEMAGGGIVAFDEGGEVPGYADGDLVSASDVFRRGLANQPSGEMPPPASDPFVMPGGYRLREFKPREALDIKGALKTLQEAETEAGVDTAKLFEQARADEQARRAELADRKREARGEAFLLAGLGLMGARQGQEFQTLAGVGQQAALQYSSALKEVRETEKDIKKSERELLFAEDKLKREQSGKALALTQEARKDREAAEAKNVEAQNKAVEAASKQFTDTNIANINAQRALEVAKMNGEYQLRVQQIASSYANKPTEGQQILSTYHSLLANKGPEAAEQYMRDWERTKNAGKSQSVYTMDDAMKAVSSMPTSAGLNEEQLVAKARKLYETVNKTTAPPAVTPPAAAVDYLKKNPALAADFDAKYGAGAAARILGAR